jgi:hypothetical protein
VQRGRDAPVLWYEEMWSVAFTTVARAALGPVLTEPQLQQLKADFRLMTRGTFAPVRIR